MPSCAIAWESEQSGYSSELSIPNSHTAVIYSSNHSAAHHIWAVETEDLEEEDKSVFSALQYFAGQKAHFACLCALILCFAALLIKVTLLSHLSEKLYPRKIRLFVEISSYRI